jgi:hypothetical protein
MDRTSEQTKSAGKDAKQGGNPPENAAPAQANEAAMSVGPTEAEVETWAEQVRQRRKAWLDGPTEEEKLEWFRRERARRMVRREVDAEDSQGPNGQTRYDARTERRRLERHYVRELRLATEGLAVLAVTLPFRVMADLVTAGQEWEEHSFQPTRRRWIPFYDDDL